jgi:hypothetical protein
VKLLERLRGRLRGLGRRRGEPDDPAEAARARAEAERRREDAMASSRRPPDPSGGGPFAGL